MSSHELNRERSNGLLVVTAGVAVFTVAVLLGAELLWVLLVSGLVTMVGVVRAATKGSHRHTKDWWQHAVVKPLPPLPDLDTPYDLPPPDTTIFERTTMPVKQHDDVELANDDTEEFGRYLDSMPGPTDIPVAIESGAIVTERTLCHELDKLLALMRDRYGTVTQYEHDMRERTSMVLGFLRELFGNLEHRRMSISEATEAVQNGEPLL